MDDSRFVAERGRAHGRTLGVANMRPSELRFTHDSVSCKFTDGNTLEHTFKMMLYDELHIGHGEMPPLVAMRYNNEWFVVRGNRRLYLLQKLEAVGKFTTVKVVKREFEEVLFNRQFTSQNMGRSIRIRGDPNIEFKLRQIINNWRESKRPHSSASMDIRYGGDSPSYNYATSDYSPPRRSYVTSDYSPPRRSYTPPPTKTQTSGDSWCIIL